MNNFLPSAVKFHYQFNLRDMSNISQGLCRMLKEYYKEPIRVARLWVHEVERVFRCVRGAGRGGGSKGCGVCACGRGDVHVGRLGGGGVWCRMHIHTHTTTTCTSPPTLHTPSPFPTLRDRMVNDADMIKFDEYRFAVTKRFFDDCGGISAVEERPLLYTSFMVSTPEDLPVYTFVPNYDALRKVLDDKLREYNESNAVMDLVLFQQAMEHITRISRIIDLPRGNAMLVGVGGSGKQSLARLASYINGYEVFQISVSSTYGVTEFKENLLALYRKAGTRGTPITFLMTDNQIVKEVFLVYINDLLATGYIADLFTPEDKEAFSNAVRNEVKVCLCYAHKHGRL